MKKLEKNVRAEIRLAVGNRDDCLIMSNPSGVGFVGKLTNPIEFKKTGTAVLKNARQMGFGLSVGNETGGFMDLIVIQKLKITPEMVGKEIGRFMGIEVKKPNGKATPIQLKKKKLVELFEARSIVADNSDDVIDFLNKF